jgi:hypothetical protein
LAVHCVPARICRRVVRCQRAATLCSALIKGPRHVGGPPDMAIAGIPAMAGPDMLQVLNPAFAGAAGLRRGLR